MCATGLPGVVAVQHPLRQLLLPGLHGPHLLHQGEVLVRGRSGDYPSALDRHTTGEIRDRLMIFNSSLLCTQKHVCRWISVVSLYSCSLLRSVALQCVVLWESM